jgi:hypothetical protein
MEMNIFNRVPLWQIDANLTIRVRFHCYPQLGVDLPLERDYTDRIEVIILCEKIPT